MIYIEYILNDKLTKLNDYSNTLGACMAGRPKRDMADWVKTQYWFRNVEKISGKGERELEETITPDCIGLDKDKKKSRSKQWRKYENGKVTPKQDRIQAVEKIYPGTAALINLPLWDLLSMNRPNPEKLRSIMAITRPNLAKYISTIKCSSELYKGQPLTNILTLDSLCKVKIDTDGKIDKKLLSNYTSLIVIMVNGENSEIHCIDHRDLLKRVVNLSILVSEEYFLSIKDEFLELLNERFLKKYPEFSKMIGQKEYKNSKRLGAGIPFSRLSRI